MEKINLSLIVLLCTVKAFAQIIIPGELTAMPILKGQGYNALKGVVAGNCVTLGAFQTQSGNETGQAAEFQLLEITTEYNLQKTLNIESAISIRFGFLGGGNGLLKFSESVNKHSQSRYLLLHTRVANQLQISKSFIFNADALALLRRNGVNSKEFAKNCGSHFVYAIRTGGEFYALFEFEIHSEEENRSFSAAIDAAGVGWKMATKINEALKIFSQFSMTQVKQYRLGGRGELPDVESLNEYARKFPSNIEMASSSPVTLELILKDYSGVGPFENWIDLSDLFVDQRLILENIAKDLSYIKEFKNTIREIKSNRSRFNFDEIIGDLQKSEPLLTQSQNALFAAAQNCLFKSSEMCRYPDNISIPSYPNIVLMDKGYRMVTTFSNFQCHQINPNHDQVCSWMPRFSRYPVFNRNELTGLCECQWPPAAIR